MRCFFQLCKDSRPEGSYWLWWPSMLNGRYKRESMQGLPTPLSLLHSCMCNTKVGGTMPSSFSLGLILAMIFQSLTMLSGSSGLEDRNNHWQTDTHKKEENVPLPLVPPPPALALKSHAWWHAAEGSFIPLERWQAVPLPTWGDVKMKKIQLVQERACQSWGPISFSKLPSIIGILSQVSEKTLLIFFSLFCQPVNKPCFSLDFFSLSFLPLTSLNLASSVPSP